jgi:hypothetical protein
MKHRAKVIIDYHYVPSHKTNVARTIARIKREQAERQRAAEQSAAAVAQEQAQKVRPIKRRPLT